jgi:hypothetical protein
VGIASSPPGPVNRFWPVFGACEVDTSRVKGLFKRAFANWRSLATRAFRCRLSMPLAELDLDGNEYTRDNKRANGTEEEDYRQQRTRYAKIVPLRA